MDCNDIKILKLSPNKTHNRKNRSAILNHLGKCELCDPIFVLDAYILNSKRLKRDARGLDYIDINFASEILFMYPNNVDVRNKFAQFLIHCASLTMVILFTKFLTRDQTIEAIVNSTVRVDFRQSIQRLNITASQKQNRTLDELANDALIMASTHLSLDVIKSFESNPLAMTPVILPLSEIHLVMDT